MSSKRAGNRSRRGFIKNAALTGLSLTTLPLLAKALEPSDLSGDKDNGITILFQGDSITDGNRGRNEDPNHIMGHGYAFSIASRVGADFPSKDIRFINKGVSGNKVTDLAQRWQQDTLDLNPSVLSILIGVNDAASNVNKGDNSVSFNLYEETYTRLLTETKSQFPDIVFVLGQPFILPVAKLKDNWNAWQTDIVKRSEIVQKLAAAFNAVYVPNQAVFNRALNNAPAEYWIWDGIHPTVAGHELMAREWIKQASKKLHFLTHYHY